MRQLTKKTAMVKVSQLVEELLRDKIGRSSLLHTYSACRAGDLTQSASHAFFRIYCGGYIFRSDYRPKVAPFKTCAACRA